MSLKLDLDGHVATLTIDRPERKNAFSLTMWADLIAACETIASAPDVRVAVMAATGDTFSAGGDFEDFASLATIKERTGYLRTVLAAYSAWERLPIPTVAAVDGVAAGGGCELAMVADIVVASDRARFGLPEARVGLFPGVAAGRARTRISSRLIDYMIYTGRLVSASEAMDGGLVTIVTSPEELSDTVDGVVTDIVAQAPGAVSAAKAAAIAFHSPGGYTLAAERIPELMSSAEHAEGLAAFAEGRAPRFEGSDE